MPGFVGRWSVLDVHDVTAADLDASGGIADSSAARWIARACAVYLERCVALRAWCEASSLQVVQRVAPGPPAAELGRPATVAVSATVTEVSRESFTIALRLRALGREDVAIDARCVVSLCDPTTGESQALPPGIRDELIAMEQRATLFN